MTERGRTATVVVLGPHLFSQPAYFEYTAFLRYKVVNVYCGKSVKLVYCTISKTLLPTVKVL